MRTDAHIIDVRLIGDLELKSCHCIICNKIQEHIWFKVNFSLDHINKDIRLLKFS